MKRIDKVVAMAAAACMAATGGVAATEDYGFAEVFVVEHQDRRPNDSTEGAAGFRVGLGWNVLESGAGTTAIELGLFHNPIRQARDDDHQTGLMLDAVHAFDLGRISPYLQLGVGVVHESRNLPLAVEGGGGLMIGLTDSLKLRWGVQAQWVNTDNTHPGENHFVDYRALLGLSRPFGAVAPPPPPPPLDSDGDGVPDGADRCPAQPAPTIDGCPTPLVPAEPERDTDADGVPDSQDECSDTLSGLQVDASGCVTTAQKIVLKGVTFVSGSTELTAEAKAVLDEAAEALVGQASLRVEVGGHTDSLGDDGINTSLSQRRAESVKSYLASKGVAADRLTAKGYGESQPVADNKTKAGRQENRRVELRVID